MDIERLDINAVCLGILCNFTPVCGEDRAKEAAGLVRALQTENEKLRVLAELGNTRAKDYRVMRDRAVKAESENEQLRAELEQVKRELEEAREAICTHCLDVPCQGESCYWWRSPKED